MIKFYKYYLFLIFLTLSFSSSMLKSVIFPGWGELNEYKALAHDNDLENISYIKERSKYIMFQESMLWIGLYIFNDLNKTYKNDYQILGIVNAGVDWTGKNELFAANVGNFNNLQEYNDYKFLTGQYDDVYLNEGYNWDWQNNNNNRLNYDRTRNKSEKYDKYKSYIAAGLIINRVISSFDVLNIMKKHGRVISFDYEENLTDIKLNLNYHF